MENGKTGCNLRAINKGGRGRTKQARMGQAHQMHDTYQVDFSPTSAYHRKYEPQDGHCTIDGWRSHLLEAYGNFALPAGPSGTNKTCEERARVARNNASGKIRRAPETRRILSIYVCRTTTCAIETRKPNYQIVASSIG